MNGLGFGEGQSTVDGTGSVRAVNNALSVGNNSKDAVRFIGSTHPMALWTY